MKAPVRIRRESVRLKRRRGFFLVIEGADASGKSTLAKRLVTTYRRLGRSVVAVREPGGTPTSERIRRILLDPKSAIGSRAELFLYLAARAQVVDDVINPALADGSLVIADRFSLSTISYQVGGRGLPLRSVRAADNLARGGTTPDFTIVLSVSESQQRARRDPHRKRDRIESESTSFVRRVRQAYSDHGRGSSVLTIDSGLGADGVFHEAQRAINRRISR